MEKRCYTGYINKTRWCLNEGIYKQQTKNNISVLYTDLQKRFLRFLKNFVRRDKR